VLGRYADAAASFRAGLDRSERLGAPYLSALTHYWWARCLLDSGTEAAGEAEEHLSAAAALAGAHGFQGIARRVARLREAR
jgi:hypothetical protein